MIWIVLAGLLGSGAGACVGFLISGLMALGDTSTESYWNTGDSSPVPINWVVGICAMIGCGLAVAMAAR